MYGAKSCLKVTAKPHQDADMLLVLLVHIQTDMRPELQPRYRFSKKCIPKPFTDRGAYSKKENFTEE